MKEINTAIKILIAEHDIHDLAMIDNELKKGGIYFVSEIVKNEAGYREAFKNFNPDIILCDYRFPSFDGPTAFKIREQLAPETPFILVSGAIGEEYSIELIKNGVTDFVLKDKMFTLPTKLLRGLKEANERKEKNKIEQDFKQTATHLAEAQILAKLGSWDYDIAADKLTWSKQLYKVFDTDKETFTETHGSFLHLIDETDRNKAEQTSRLTKETGDRFILEYGITTPKGEKRIIQEHGYGVKDAEGKVIRLFGTAQDITERKKAENAVKESEAKYRAFFDNSMDGILLTVTDGKILAANPAACKIFKMTEQEICDTGRFGLVDLSDPRVENLIKQRQLTNESHGELTLLRKDGTTFAGEISSVLFTDSFGQERTSMIIRDISDRKETEERLALTSGKLQSTLNDLTNILDSSLDVICAVDEQGIFKKVSAASEAVWGYKPTELIGKPIINFIYPEDHTKTLAKAGHVMAGNSNYYFENRYISKDGSLVSMEWSSRWDKKAGLRYGVARDVTEKKRLEKAIDIERQRFLGLYLQSPSCMGILKGPNHVYETANPLYLQLIGKTNIIGKPLKEVLPEMDAQGIFEILDNVYKTGETFSANEMLIQFDLHGTGKLVDTYLNFIYQAHRDDQNEINGILFFAIDVTEQVLSKKKIEESYKDFQFVTDFMPQLIWVTKPDGYHSYYNKQWYDYTGLAPHETEGEGWNDVFHPDDQDRAWGLWRHSLETGEPYEIEYRCRRYDGEYRWFLGRALPLKDSTGSILKWFGTCTDIDDQKKAEEKLITSNRHFAFISAINHSIVHIKEKEELLQQACSIALEIGNFKVAWIGMLNEEDKLEVINVLGEGAAVGVVKKRWEIDVQNSPFRNTSVGKALRNGIYAVSNDVLKDPDMHFLNEELLNTGIRANIVFPIKKSGKVTGVFSFNSDTVNFFDNAEIVLLQEATDNISFAIENFDREERHKKAEEKIIENEKRLQLATSSAGLGVWDWDIKNNVLTWDEAMYRLYNITGTEFNSVYEGWFSRLHQEDRQQVENHMQLALANKKDYNPEFRIVWGDSSVHYINASAIIERDNDGNAIRMIGINWEVTERKLAEILLTELNENLQKNAKELLISNAELEQFAYVASHDLQEPLRMITSFLTQLERKYGDVIDDKGKKYIGFAVDGAKRMRQIILDLLEYSRVGRRDVDKEAVDLNEMIHDIKMLLRKKIEEQNAVIIIDQLPTLHTYQLPLHQVFQNLISNALKYSSKEIPVQIHITAKELKEHWQFDVIDNGIGIDKKYFEKIFIIFQRLHNMEEYSGTGMGLAIAKKIIEAQGGKIWVASEEGKGSAFYFTIKK